MHTALKIQVFTILLIWCLGSFGSVHAQKVYRHLDSLLKDVRFSSKSVRADLIQMEQARKAKLAAIVGVADLGGGVAFSYTNNTQLPVNLFPAEIFGGEKGTFREVQSGIQYVSNLNEYLELKLFNLSGWEKLRASKINIELVNSGHQVNLKNLHNLITDLYFNIVNLQEQIRITQLYVASADTLLQISQRKYQQGLANQQQVNDSRVNYLQTLETIRQLKFLLAEQYNNLKMQGDFPVTDSLLIQSNPTFETTETLPNLLQANQLEIRNSEWQEKMAWSTYRQHKLALLPSISFFLSHSDQQYNTASTLFDRDVRWIPSSFLGIKLNLAIPSAQAIAQISQARYDHQLAQENTAHLRIKADLEARQLYQNWQKALAQSQTKAAIHTLQQESYQKNLDLYRAGLIALDQTLNSYNAMVNSHYESISIQVGVLLAQAKIQLNNPIK